MTSAPRGALPRWRPAGLAWTLWALAMLGLAVVLWLDHRLRQAGRPDLTQVLPLLPHCVVGVGSATVGVLLASRRPRHPVGWLLLVFGLATMLNGIFAGYALHVLATRPRDVAVAGWAAWFGDLSFAPAPASGAASSVQCLR